MARGTGGGKKEQSSSEEHGKPKYPYSNKPGSLRRFLEIVPTKPKPPKVVMSTLKTWGFRDSNDQSILRVLKAVGLLDSSNAPTDDYAAFMVKDAGPAALGRRVRETYPELFQHVTDPARASAEELKSFFLINSGGSDKTIEYQVQTFKALADNSRFDEAATAASPAPRAAGSASVPMPAPSADGRPVFHIDLHVHLPENKSRIDYDGIFASIAEHILGKKS